MLVTLVLAACAVMTEPRVHLVIAPERFREPLRAYLAQRRDHSPHLSGCEFVTLEQVLSRTTGRDDPERVKRYLYARWKSGGLVSCLLVGDCDAMPVRSMVLDRFTEAANNWAFYPCDLYYADLAKRDGSFDDWNGAAEGFHAGYFGEVHGESIKTDAINFDGIDYRPEIAVGRWPVSSADACAAVVAKTIAFEKALPPPPTTDAKAAPADAAAQRPLAAFFAVGGWVDARERVKRMAKALEARGATRLFIHDIEGSPPPDVEHMRATLAEGPRFVFHTGHGSPGAYEGCLAMSTLEGVAQPSLPITFSVGCSTAEIMSLGPYQAYVDVDGVEHVGTDNGEKFTAPPPPPAPYQSGARNRSSIAEELVRRPSGGAVAAIGCDTGAQPCAVTLLEGFTAALADPAGPDTLGGLWNEALMHYVDAEHLADLKPTDSWYPPSIFFQGMKFVLLGDPALRVR